MEYLLDRTKIMRMVEMEVSHIAARAYGDDGKSLYDGIIITSHNRELVLGMLNDAYERFYVRMGKYVHPLGGYRWLGPDSANYYCPVLNPNVGTTMYDAEGAAAGTFFVLVAPGPQGTTQYITKLKKYDDTLINITSKEGEGRTANNRGYQDGFVTDLPDIDESVVPSIKEILERYLRLSTISAWMQETYVAKAQEYAERAQMAMDETVKLLLGRKPLERRV